MSGNIHNISNKTHTIIKLIKMDQNIYNIMYIIIFGNNNTTNEQILTTMYAVPSGDNFPGMRTNFCQICCT